MTFQEWQATRRYHAQLPDDMAPDCGAGWEYEAGYIVDYRQNPIQGDTERYEYHVPLPQEDRGFHTLDDAEQFLWTEWCSSEINGGTAA